VTQRIYTRTGDEGDTGLFGGGRVSKAHPRVEAYGAVDELNAMLGWAHAVSNDASIRTLIEGVQGDLFAIGAHLATPPAEGGRREPWLPPLPDDRIGVLERWIDTADVELAPLRSFILPGGSPAGAALHLGRTVCRRAERRVVAFAAEAAVDPAIVIYLNRLSDVLFVAARLANARAGVAEPRWEPRTGDDG
jgi:cob(I)alamin adenosyltransferase